MQDEIRETFWERYGDTTPRDRRNMMLLLLSYALWAICLTGATQVAKRGLLKIESPVLPNLLLWGAVISPAVAGLLAIFTYRRYLRHADEMQRLIHLDTLALTAGGTFFGYAAYSVFERLGASPANFGDISLLMAGLYMFGIFLGWWRYR